MREKPLFPINFLINKKLPFEPMEFILLVPDLTKFVKMVVGGGGSLVTLLSWDIEKATGVLIKFKSYYTLLIASPNLEE